MQSFREPATATHIEPSISLPVPISLLISLASAPLLAALISGRTAAHSLIQIGISSEEIFRGDRLPTLPLLPTDTSTLSE